MDGQMSAGHLGSVRRVSRHARGPVRRLRPARAVRWAAAAATAIALAGAGTTAPALAAGARPAAAGSAGPAAAFDTSFESGQPQPTWASTTQTGPDGTPVCSGVTQSAGGPAGMTTSVGSGPSAAYAAKTGAGFTGVKAFSYGGDQTGAGSAYCDDRVFATDIAVTARTQLSYDILPVLMNSDLGEGIPDPSSYAVIDLAFSDGSYLSQLHAVDGNGYGMTAAAQGAAGDLYPNQWNQVTASIGAVAAGKTITRILVDYGHTGPAGDFQGWIDDLDITAAAQPRHAHLADYAITTSGTASNGSYSRGNNIPATAMPHGFNFLTPETDAGTTSWLYNYSTDNNAQNDPQLQALAISHEPSVWVNDRDTFEVMPGAGTAGSAPDMSRSARQLPFSHSDEIARPYYYSVTFRNGIKAEMTPTDHAAVFRFTFTGSASDLIFDNVNDNGALALNPSGDSISGFSNVQGAFGAPGDGPMYFYATFSQPVTRSGMAAAGGCDGSACGGSDVTGYYQFATGVSRTVTMEIGTSYISVAQAEHNLQLEISPADTFASVQARALAAWDKALGVITVARATPAQLATLYTSLYRLNLYPDEAYENAGTSARPDYEYASPTAPAAGPNTPARTGLAIRHGYMYVNGGSWDTYRTAWPLDMLLYPKLTGQMLTGFVNQYRDGGWLNRWSAPGYAGSAPGSNLDSVFAQAYLDGIRNFPVAEAYQAIKKDAMTAPTGGAVGRQGQESEAFTGYSPSDAGSGSVDWALEDDLSDYGISAMAAALAAAPGVSTAQRAAYRTDAGYFQAQSENYVRLFNPATGFFEGRTASGDWDQPASQFDPRVWGNEFQESDGWTYAFYTPQDGQGLADLYGGRQALASKLDQYFGTHETAQFGGSYGGANAIHEMVEAATDDQGQWVLNNQPGFGIPYFYDFTGEPYKAQPIIRTALQRDFTGTAVGQGYPGDEDNGALASWYIFSALGIYPLQSGTTSYVIGSPLFSAATVHLPGGRTLTIDAKDNSTSNVYVQSVALNGQPVRTTQLSQAQLDRGGVLRFDMGPGPSSWGTAASAAPDSLSTAGRGPQLLQDAAGTGSGTASASDGTDVSVLFDDTSTTQVTFSSATPWVQENLSGPARVSYYTLTSGTADGDPTAWTLQGSDDGSQWTTLDTRSGQIFTSRQQTEDFAVARPGSYRDYRLQVTAATSSQPALSEVQLLTLGQVPAIAFTDPEAAEPSGGIQVSPGGSVAVTVGAQNITSRAEQISWSATAPAGVTAGGPGSFSAAAYAKGTATVSLTVPDRAGVFPVVFRLRAGGMALPPVTLRLLVLTPGDLSPFLNNVGVSDDSAPGSGNIDGLSNSYSAEALAAAGVTGGSAITAGGLTFTWPDAPAGQADNVVADGQTIPLAAGAGATTVGILGSATFGPSQGTATITYTDGSTQAFPLDVSDWTLAGGLQPGDTEAVQMSYRNAPGGPDQSATFVLAITAALQPGKTVQSITLPASVSQGDIHVFAIAAG